MDGTLKRIECEGCERLQVLSTGIGLLTCSFMQPDEDLGPGRTTTYFSLGETIDLSLLLKFVIRFAVLDTIADLGITQARSSSPSSSVTGVVAKKIAADTYILDIGKDMLLHIDFESDVDLNVGDCITAQGELSLMSNEE